MRRWRRRRRGLEHRAAARSGRQRCPAVRLSLVGVRQLERLVRRRTVLLWLLLLSRRVRLLLMRGSRIVVVV